MISQCISQLFHLQGLVEVTLKLKSNTFRGVIVDVENECKLSNPVHYCSTQPLLFHPVHYLLPLLYITVIQESFMTIFFLAILLPMVNFISTKIVSQTILLFAVFIDTGVPTTWLVFVIGIMLLTVLIVTLLLISARCYHRRHQRTCTMNGVCSFQFLHALHTCTYIYICTCSSMQIDTMRISVIKSIDAKNLVLILVQEISSCEND